MSLPQYRYPMDEMQAHECRATPDGRRPCGLSWRDTRAALILLGAADVVGVAVLVGALLPQDRGAPPKEPTASSVAVPRVLAPAATRIFMATTEPEIQPPVPGPSVPTMPPHGYGPIPSPHERVPILTPAPGDPCHPNC
jgi:hypothetical protein